MPKVNLKFVILLLIIVLAALTRLLPLPPNFAPVAAIALFGGAMFSNRLIAMLLPLTVMFISDLLIGLHATLMFVYLSFALIVGIGMLVGKNYTIPKLTGAALGGSLLFFIITNFGVWLVSAYYPLNMTGLVTCYTAALPFFHYTVLGDLFFTTVIFGSFEAVRRMVPSLQPA